MLKDFIVDSFVSPQGSIIEDEQGELWLIITNNDLRNFLNKKEELTYDKTNARKIIHNV